MILFYFHYATTSGSYSLECTIPWNIEFLPPISWFSFTTYHNRLPGCPNQPFGTSNCSSPKGMGRKVQGSRMHRVVCLGCVDCRRSTLEAPTSSNSLRAVTGWWRMDWLVNNMPDFPIMFLWRNKFQHQTKSAAKIDWILYAICAARIHPKQVKTVVRLGGCNDATTCINQWFYIHNCIS